ncbi:alpha/beta fold hydrolase [Rhodococcus sp. (in: high G+C Gram-positive bacteria)]|uniref:alpha/beta fold hydrolase n=1 Tax=Rhodococcus sp. TaxID=1831 RepID=UPI003B8A7F41
MVTSAYRRGSGEPVLLLHGFTLSHHVWHRVADDLASDYDVLALTMPGHWGGPRLRWRDLGVAGIADGVEGELDAMGWDTCHVVGNSLGGQVAFELARRGRARSVAGVNPGGGWKRFSRIEFRVGSGFVAQFPLMALARVLGDRAAAHRFFQRPVIANCSHDVSAVDLDDATNVIRAVSHCPVYLPILSAFLRDGPLRGLDRIAVPTSLILGEFDTFLPRDTCMQRFVDELSGEVEEIVLPGVGHIPMLEAPDVVARALRMHLERVVGCDDVA